MTQMSAGIDPTLVRTSTEGPAFKLGTVVWEADNPALLSAAMGVTGGSGGTPEGVKAYMYVQADAGGFTGAGYAVLINGASYEGDMADTTASAPGTGAGKQVGIACAAVAASGYGWVQVYGPCVVRVAASCAAHTIINTTATAGQLDDDATAGAEVVDGLVLTTANGGAAATAAGFAAFPRVGRTL